MNSVLVAGMPILVLIEGMLKQGRRGWLIEMLEPVLILA